MFGFLWDLQQDRLIAKAQSRAEHAAIDAAASAQRVEELVRENERLQTITMALWSLMKERLALEDDELSARVRELAQVRRAHDHCERCRRRKSVHTGRCIYCT
jgi:hypothetical protein